MNFIIETASPSDLNQILELNQKALPAVSSVNLKEMQHFLKIVDYFKTLKVNNKVAGFLIALTPGKDYNSVNYKWFENKYESFMYVDRIVVAPTYQGHGFGTAFYNDLSNFSKNIIPRITCEVNINPPNKESMLFHTKYGFKQVGTQFTEIGKKEVSLMKLSI
jgi:predicted GNAT superfamily acetyltransferase